MAVFNPVGPSTISGTVSTESKSSFSVSGAVIGTIETTLSIPIGTKAFRLQVADGGGAAVLSISHTVGGTASAITSLDIYAGSSWSEESLTGAAALTLYIKSNKANTNVQLLLWS